MSDTSQTGNRFGNFSFLKLSRNKPNDRQKDTDVNRQKSRLFSAFVGAVTLLALLVALNNLYFSLVLEGEAAAERSYFVYSNLRTAIILGVLWLGHRRYPTLARHIFLSFIVIGATYLFSFEDLNTVMVVFTMPILMAAFLLHPLNSFLYYIFLVVAYTIKYFSSGLTLADDQFDYISLGVFLVISVIAWLIASILNNALTKSQNLNEELDQRVQKRTEELAETLAREQTLSARNKTILESITDGIIVFDADNQVFMANPAAAQLAKQDLQSVYFKDLLKTISDENITALEDWLNGKAPSDGNNIRLRWHDKTLSANVAPVILAKESEQQVDGGHVIVLRDFTKEAQLERAKDIFFGMVSHELRTPMSAINGYVDILLDLEKDHISGEGLEYLQTIRSSTQQLLSLANDLIDLSRLETGEIELYRQPVDISDIVQHAVKIVQQEFSARNLSLAVESEADLPQLQIDQRRILQVLLNLLSNAYKYTNTGGTTVHIYQAKETINIAIKDTGIGIRPADQVHLFTRFFRAADQTVQKVSGTGLGLSISRGFTELHGGKLVCESEYGVGTTFTVMLPLNGLNSPIQSN